MKNNIQCEHCPSKDKGIFCNLEKETLGEVSQNKVMNTYKKGQTIFHQGNPPFGLYCISSGKIKVYKTGSDGKETIVRIVGPGDVLGHRSLFSHENYNATATVIEDTQVCFIDKNFIHNAIKKEPAVALNLIEKFSREMGTAEARSASISNKSTKERLAELLLNFAQSYGSTELDGRIRLNIKLTREEYASMVGAVQETIIRLFTDFKEEGVLEQDGKIIFIVDKKKLLEIANLDY